MRFRRGLFVLLWTVLLAPSAAIAAPPTLLSVGQTARHLTAAWSLPPGAQSRVIEAATSPNTGSDGYFFQENVGLFDTLQDAQTSYLSTSQLNPGLYYVHVASYQSDCVSCPIREFSNILTIAIPPDPAPPPPPDTVKPISVIGGPSAQRLGKLYVTGMMGEPGTLLATATVSVRHAAKAYHFKRVKRKVAANVSTKLRLKLTNSAKRAVKRALKRGRKLRARITLTATDNAGNATVKKRRIRLKP